MSPAGILWANSKITHPDSITPENFNKWYNEVHISDLLATSAFKCAFRYQSINPSAEHPYLAIYPVADVNWLVGEEFASIPLTSDYFPGPSHLCFDFVHFDTRFYEFVHRFEKEGVKSGPTKLILSAALTPALGTDADFNAWYIEEHYGALATCPGYVRTRRYKLKTAFRSEDTPTYLALHEFESETLPQADLAKIADTPWAKKVMGSLLGKEVGVFALTGAWGEVNLRF